MCIYIQWRSLGESFYKGVAIIQWNLRIKDILGPAISSTIERLSSSWRSKNVWEILILEYYEQWRI